MPGIENGVVCRSMKRKRLTDRTILEDLHQEVKFMSTALIRTRLDLADLIEVLSGGKAKGKRRRASHDTFIWTSEDEGKARENNIPKGVTIEGQNEKFWEA